MPECLIIGGLILDIIGAIFIAMPDIPILDRYFEFGKLRKGRELMESGGVSEGDVGFSEVSNILEDIEPIEEFDDESNQLREITVHRRQGLTNDKIEESDIGWGDQYVEARYSKSSSLDETVFYDSGEIYRALEDRIDTQIIKYRLFGLLLLATGFFFQLLGTHLQ